MIGSGAFSGLSMLICVYWLGSIITTPNDIFTGSQSAIPCGSLTLSGTSSGSRTYQSNLNITSVTIPSTITFLGNFNIHFLIYT